MITKFYPAAKALCVLFFAGFVVPASGVTVEVNGQPDAPPVSFEKLSGAVAYLNTLDSGSTEPDVVNITANQISDDGQILIRSPLTINGDADGDTSSCQVLVDQYTMQWADDLGMPARSYIEIATSGSVALNNLVIHAGTPYILSIPVNGISTYRPEEGTGDYVLDHVVLTGSDPDTQEPLPLATEDDNYFGSITWTAYSSTTLGPGNGVYNFTNDGGSGAYNITLNDCQGGICRGHVINDANQGGKTVIRGGVFAHAGLNIICLRGATGVSVEGTGTDRVRLLRAKRSTAKPTFQSAVAVDGGQVDAFRYIDCYLNDVLCSPFIFDHTTVTLMEYCRCWNGYIRGGAPLEIRGDASAVIRNCTFHEDASGPDRVADPAVVRMAESYSGTVAFSDCVFTSVKNGNLRIDGTGHASFDHCAFPVDDTMENLDPALPVDIGTSATVTRTASMNESPAYKAVSFNVADGSNADWLRPTNPHYQAAASDGGVLTGGAGPDETGVDEWELY